MDFYVLIAIAVSGVIFKMLEKVIALRSTHDGKGITLVAYIKENPYRTALSVIGAVGSFYLFDSTGQLNEASAFAAGYFGESGARFLTQKFNVGEK